MRQDKPNPIVLEHLTTLQMMSRPWCIKNKSDKPLDFKNKEETFASRNANGTGPFMLVSREPDVKTVLDPVLHSKDGKGKGDYNCGRYVNAKLDELTDAAAVETNPEKRKTMVTDALLACRT